MESKRVVVIGGGLSGLAASYDLARAGHHVVLLEALRTSAAWPAPFASRATRSSASTTSSAVPIAIS
jgi:glycine/D-amino acid oxidase-like deaminating enzyme